MNKNTPMTTFLWLLLIPAAFYILLMTGMYFYQERLMFPGTPLPANHTFAFEQDFTEISIPADGTTLNALHFQQANPKGLVFFLHGNAGNLDTWATHLDFYQKLNYDLFLLDYRGYGKSTGTISSQQQLHNDVRMAWDLISSQYQEKNIPITIYGRSLGAALATRLATQVPHQQLILVSPFSSMKAMVKQHYPYVPTSLLRYPFPTEHIINQVPGEITFIVGDQDFYIPVSEAEKLQQLTKHPSNMLVVNGAEHGDIDEFDQYWEFFKEILER